MDIKACPYFGKKWTNTPVPIFHWSGQIRLSPNSTFQGGENEKGFVKNRWYDSRALRSGLEKYLNKQDGIINATVNLVMNNASIEYDEKKLDIPQIEKFVQKAGFESLGIDNFQKEEKKKSRQKYKLWGFTIIAIVTLYIAMGHMIGLPGIPFLDMHTYPINYTIALLILSIIAIVMGWDILKKWI